jgi:hypothetical protein
MTAEAFEKIEAKLDGQQALTPAVKHMDELDFLKPYINAYAAVPLYQMGELERQILQRLLQKLLRAAHLQHYQGAVPAALKAEQDRAAQDFEQAKKSLKTFLLSRNGLNRSNQILSTLHLLINSGIYSHEAMAALDQVINETYNTVMWTKAHGVLQHIRILQIRQEIAADPQSLAGEKINAARDQSLHREYLRKPGSVLRNASVLQPSRQPANTGTPNFSIPAQLHQLIWLLLRKI